MPRRGTYPKMRRSVKKVPHSVADSSSSGTSSVMLQDPLWISSHVEHIVRESHELLTSERSERQAKFQDGSGFRFVPAQKKTHHCPLLLALISSVLQSELPDILRRSSGQLSPEHQRQVEFSTSQVAAEVLSTWEGSGLCTKTAEVGGSLRPWVLSALATEIDDVDVSLSSALNEGVNVGFRSEIPPISSDNLLPPFQPRSRLDEPPSLVWSEGNYRSASDPSVHQAVLDVIHKEVALGYLVVVASSTVQHKCRLGAIPKMSGGSYTGAVRLVEDHRRSGLSGLLHQSESWPLPSYLDLFTLIQSVLSEHSGISIAQIDISSAFRHIFVNPLDRPYLCYTYEGKWFMNKALPFGLRTSPYWWCRFSGLMPRITLYLLRLACGDKVGMFGSLTFVDDITVLLSLLAHLDIAAVCALVIVLWTVVGVLVSWPKLFLGSFMPEQQGFATKVLGYMLNCSDSGSVSLSIPREKLHMMIQTLQDLVAPTTTMVSVRSLQQTVGRLQWFATLLPFVRPMLASFYAALGVCTRKNLHFFPLPRSAAVRKDSGRLLKLLTRDEECLLVPVPLLRSAVKDSIIVVSDASIFALGGFVVLPQKSAHGGKVLFYQCIIADLPSTIRQHLLGNPSRASSRDIATLELFSATLGVLVAGDLPGIPSNAPIILRSDNSAVISMFAKFHTKLTRALPFLQCISHSFGNLQRRIHAYHLSGVHNGLADWISRSEASCLTLSSNGFLNEFTPVDLSRVIQEVCRLFESI